MEARLKYQYRQSNDNANLLIAYHRGLQRKMQETAPLPSASGGALWKSARPDKGSVTAYAKDVQEKLKNKKLSDKTDKATAEGRRLARKKSAAHFTEKGMKVIFIISECVTE